ncbi:MAG: IS30 family transposase [Bradyrhizobiaceae bacterium]|nr:IS30 family transposase [Bradyrhizobiaceae bacterium]
MSKEWGSVRGVELCAEEREIISREISSGLSCRAIGRVLGRSHSVISREVARNGGRHRYRATAAQARAVQFRERPKVRKLMVNRRLHDLVSDGLAQDWSPRQISRRLRVDFPGEDTLRVSHETIYQTLYLQARGELRTELKLALRQGRALRVPRTRVSTTRGKIPNMVNISQRPPEADDRAVPGFWEGDLILGKGSKSQIATLVERHTRFVMLVKIPYDRNADKVARLLARKMQTLPEFLRHSITWDQGKELTNHAEFTVKTGIKVYFCDPHAPWQRGSNENTNGLLRQYFPKGTDLSVHSQKHLDAIADQLNGRPRETLGWLKPTEVLNALLNEANGAPTT